MKKWLSTRGSLATCLTVYDDFYAYRTGVYRHVTGNLAGGHCVCCVGYDDAQGCWICKNSWSTGWGDAGFFRIAYGQVGIDATMWAVDGIVTAVWHNNTKITSLWATNEDRNAWAYVDGVGWRRVAYDSDSIFINMLTLLASAKASGRPVNLYEDQGVIKQVYVL